MALSRRRASAAYAGNNRREASAHSLSSFDTPHQPQIKLRTPPASASLLGQLAHVLWLARHIGLAFNTGAIAELFDAGWRELSWLGLVSANPNPKPNPYPNPLPLP